MSCFKEWIKYEWYPKKKKKKPTIRGFILKSNGQGDIKMIKKDKSLIITNTGRALYRGVFTVG